MRADRAWGDVSNAAIGPRLVGFVRPAPDSIESGQMHSPLLRKLSLWSVLGALLACNSLVAVEPSVQTARPPGAGAGTGTTFDVDVRGSVYYLASDDLEGRGVGTDGLKQAPAFLAGP